MVVPPSIASDMRAQPPDIDDPERPLTLRQADQARSDFAVILDDWRS
jgi:hypothetical protein